MMVARSILARLMVAVVVMVGAVAVGMVAPAPAHARCADRNLPITSTLQSGSTIFVSEVPSEGECNGDNTYRFQYRSHLQGWRAWVWIQNNGVWTWHRGSYGSTGWFGSFYRDNNSYSYIQFCIENFDDGTRWYCGWGTNVATGTSSSGTFPDHSTMPYGINKGF
jgi:hypothetical protein